MKAYFNWSGGKDSCLALHHVLQDPTISISCLLTTVNEVQNRISMHGVRNTLLEQQAEAIGLPLHKVFLPNEPTMESYETAMEKGMKPLINTGNTHSIFGDIFLEDLRAYRDEKLKTFGLTGIYPLWKRDTKAVIQEFLALGYKTIVVCVDAAKLDASFVGRTIDAKFLADLPAGVDPCGENGEFHTFVYDGPIFKQAINFQIGEIVFREYAQKKNDSADTSCVTANTEIHHGFWYVDLLN